MWPARVWMCRCSPRPPDPARLAQRRQRLPSVTQQGPVGACSPAVSASEAPVCSKLEAGRRVPGGRRAAGGWAGAKVPARWRPPPALASLHGPCFWSRLLPPWWGWDLPQVPGSATECRRLPSVPGTVCPRGQGVLSTPGPQLQGSSSRQASAGALGRGREGGARVQPQTSRLGSLAGAVSEEKPWRGEPRPSSRPQIWDPPSLGAERRALGVDLRASEPGAPGGLLKALGAHAPPCSPPFLSSKRSQPGGGGQGPGGGAKAPHPSLRAEVRVRSHTSQRPGARVPTAGGTWVSVQSRRPVHRADGGQSQ